MEFIEKKELNQLLNYVADDCISIFISTNRLGKEVLEEKDRNKLKGEWDQCKRNLNERGTSKETIKKIEQQFQKLIDDQDFWRHQSDGLAIFAAEDFFKYYTLPINFEDHTYVSTDFYVRSLAPALSVNDKFFVLALQLEEVKLYEATKYSLSEIKIDDLIPSKLKDQVGYDYEEKHLQMRSQQEGDNNALYHGQGAGDRDKKKEIYQFFNAVDKGISEVLTKEHAPLVVFCQDYLFPIYEEANSYNNLFQDQVKGNPNDVDLNGLHEKAEKTVEPYLTREKEKKIKSYTAVSPSQKSDVIQDVVSLAFEGKIDTLFLTNREEIWGSFDENTFQVSVHDEPTSESHSLMNLAAKETLKNGGSVYLTDSAFMPDHNTKVNALLRYS